MWHVCTLCKWYESVRVTSSNSHRAYSAAPTLRKGNVQRNCQALSGQVLCLSYESLNSVDSVLYISIYFEEIWFDGKRCKRCNRYCTRLFPFTRFLASWDSSLTCITAPRWIKSKTNIYLRPFETTGWLEKTEKKLKNCKHLEVIWGNTHRSTDEDTFQNNEMQTRFPCRSCRQ